MIEVFGDVAQLGERGVRNAEARSSILLISTKLLDEPIGSSFYFVLSGAKIRPTG